MTSTPHATSAVTVVGLGKMGAAIAAALLAGGHQVTVWNRTASKADGLLAQGARRADTIDDALAASPLVIVTLFDYDSVRAVLAHAREFPAGRTLVNLTTGTPEEARIMAGWASEQGLMYLDGAMMAVPETVATPAGFFLYSGSKEVFEAYEATLRVMATSHYLGADAGNAAFYDAGLIGTVYGTLAGFLHSITLLDTVGVPPTRFAGLAAQWLEGMIPFLSVLAEEMESKDYADGDSSVDINQKAVTNLVRLSQDRGVDAAVHVPLQALLDRQVARGRGSDSFASLFELLKSPQPSR